VLDPTHASVIARVSHVGYSYSVFRFGRLDGTLRWDPADPARSMLEATVWTASIETPVEGFAKQLSGDGFLKSATFPQAVFTSTAFRRTSATQGRVEGQLTMMGHTRPVTFDVKLVGAGAGFGGKPRIGIEGHASLDPKDFGLPAVFDQRYVKRLSGPNVKKGKNKKDLADVIRFHRSARGSVETTFRIRLLRD